MPNEPYDDQTEIASPSGKRAKRTKKFIDSETQLKTEIYQGDPIVKSPLPAIPPVEASPPSVAIGTPAPTPALKEEDPAPQPEVRARMQHVFSVAESLLADLGPQTQTNVTMPGKRKARRDDEEVCERAITEVEDIEEPPRLPISASPPSRSIGEHSPGTAPTDISDFPDPGDTDEDIDATDHTTQTEAAPIDAPAPGGPTIPGHAPVPAGPLSQQPFAPGPMSPLAVSPDGSGDTLGTIATEGPVQRGPATRMTPARFQEPHPPMIPARRGFLGMWDSVMRFFGRRPPPPPPPPMDDDDDFSAYGRSTYTHANRLVARSGKRYDKKD